MTGITFIVTIAVIFALKAFFSNKSEKNSPKNYVNNHNLNTRDMKDQLNAHSVENNTYNISM